MHVGISDSMSQSKISDVAVRCTLVSVENCKKNEKNCSKLFFKHQQGHFVTKIPEREECYIKPFPIADEQSIRETRQNLELVQVMYISCTIILNYWDC